MYYIVRINWDKYELVCDYQLSMCDFFTINGTGSLVPLKGMMNSIKYIEILCRRIVQFMETFGDTFQHDLVPCHT